MQQAAELVQLDGDAFESPAGALSGGMKRRLSIALTLVGLPGIIFMDEPTTGIDAEQKHCIWQILQTLKSEKTCTVIFTTHLMDEAIG